MYTEEDVKVVWLKSKYCKQRGIAAIDNERKQYFEEALHQHKQIIVVVVNIVKYIRDLRRIDFTLRCGRLLKPDERPAQTIDVENYWNVIVPDEVEAAQFFRPANEFSRISVVQPLGEYAGDKLLNNEAWRDPARVRREPRLCLYPRFGPDYVHNLEDSIPFKDMLEWTHVLHAAYQAISLQFFKNGKLE